MKNNYEEIHTNTEREIEREREENHNLILT